MFMKDFSQLLSSSLNAWRLFTVWGSVCCLGLMGVIFWQPFFAVGDLTRDPATIALHPPYFGAVSNLGLLLWSASAAVCFLSLVLLRVMQPERKDLCAFFAVFAGLNTVLCLDDTFLLHEAILPNRLPFLRIPEPVVLATYVLILLGAVVTFRKLLLKNQPLLFGFILLLFAVSVGFDQLPSSQWLSEDAVFLIEDGAKLLAIFLWLAYFARASIYFVAQSQFSLLTSSSASSSSSVSLASTATRESRN